MVPHIFHLHYRKKAKGGENERKMEKKRIKERERKVTANCVTPSLVQLSLSNVILSFYEENDMSSCFLLLF